MFGLADLGDRRLNRRAVDVAATLAARPTSSLCSAYQEWSKIKGAYRLIENDRVEVDALRACSSHAAVQAVRRLPKVLAVSDTTALNFTNRRATNGLGPIGRSTSPRGLWLHSTILLRLDGFPLGLLAQHSWTRDPKEHGQRHRRRDRPFESKESYRWLQSVTESAELLDSLAEEERPHLLHVFDREGDIHEVFEAVLKTGDGCVIRSSWNRRIEHPCGRLHEAVLTQPALGSRTIEVPRKQGERKRQAHVEYRACSVRVTPRKDLHPNRSPYDIHVVAVTEANPPESVKKPLHWILVTTEPIDTLEEVLEVVRIYTLRWRVEDYHYVLKSGCRLEKVQFETAERILRAAAILAAVAVRILQLTHQARLEPNLPCTKILSETEWRALYTQIKGESPCAKARPPTLRTAVMWIGRLSGFVGRKSDGMPGVRSVWEGYRDLQLLASLYETLTDQKNQTTKR